MVHKEHALRFSRYLIHAETSRSWVCIPMEKASRSSRLGVVDQTCRVKLPKNFKGFTIAVDETTAKLNNWAFNNRYKLSDMVEHCCEPTTLLAIAKLVGFEYRRHQWLRFSRSPSTKTPPSRARLKASMVKDALKRSPTCSPHLAGRR